jgi:hypothetical protein
MRHEDKHLVFVRIKRLIGNPLDRSSFTRADDLDRALVLERPDNLVEFSLIDGDRGLLFERFDRASPGQTSPPACFEHGQDL